MSTGEEDFNKSVSPAPGDSPAVLGMKLVTLAHVEKPTPVHAGIAGQLIALGADVFSQDEYGRTALLNAAHAGNAVLVKALLEKGADPNAAETQWSSEGNLGPTICQAAYKGNAEIIRLLLAAGADPNAQEKPGGRSALILAIDYGSDEKGNSVINAAGNGNGNGRPAASVTALVEGGAAPDLATQKGWTPLLYCFTREMPETAKYLIRHGADPALKTAVNTPYDAAKSRYPEVAQVILDAIAQKREAARVAEESRRQVDQWTKEGCPTSSPVRLKPVLKFRAKLR